MTAAIIIPARYGSTRLRGKPMISIAGASMLERVWRIAKSVIARNDPRTKPGGRSQ